MFSSRKPGELSRQVEQRSRGPNSSSNYSLNHTTKAFREDTGRLGKTELLTEPGTGYAGK